MFSGLLHEDFSATAPTSTAVVLTSLEKAIISHVKRWKFYNFRPTTLQYKIKTPTSRIPMIITHHPCSPPIRNWLNENLSTQHNGNKMKMAVPTAPVGERNCRSLKTFLCRLCYLLLPVHLHKYQAVSNAPRTKFALCQGHLVKTNHFFSSTT